MGWVFKGKKRFTAKLQVLWKKLNNKVVGNKKICNFNIYIFSVNLKIYVKNLICIVENGALLSLLSPDVYTSSSTTLNNPLPDKDLS